MKKLIFAILSLTMVFISIPSFAGDIDSPGSPSSGSGMCTLLQLYNYLNNGIVPTIVTSFQEPSAGPGSTMKSTKSIYDDTKAKFDQCDSVASDVAAGKKFFSTQGTWGVQTGTGITSTGDAVAADVLSGKTFSNSSSAGLSGTMTSITPQPITPTTASQTISQGYHTGSGYVEGDTGLISGNIKSGESIFGVSGATNVVDTTEASNPVVATRMKTGDVGFVNGTQVTGTGTQTLSVASNNVTEGYYAATTLSTVDTNLATGNIKAGVNIFGVSGDTNVVNTSSGDATATDIRTGDKAWVGGSEVTGTGCAEVAKTGQKDCYFDNGSTGTCTCGDANCPDGQDGDLEKGVEWPSTRFTASNGTVTDNLTGLIWLQNADVPEAQRTWAQAFSDVAELNSGGTMNGGKSSGDTSNGGSHQIDWRLPNVEELSSLIDFGRFDPALPEGHPFANVQSSIYWTSTTRADNTSNAWHVSLFNGNANYASKSGSTAYVWPVRGGQ